MDSFYFEQLPLDVKKIVLEIEAQIKREIQIEVQPSERDVLACNVEGIYPMIIIPKSDFFPESSVLHELLHIERFLVAGVPSLTVAESHWSIVAQQAFCGIDNDLEHLAIIPREIQMRPERLHYWENKFEISIKKIEIIHNGAKEKTPFAMRAWINVNIALANIKLQESCLDILEQENLVQKAEDFLVDVTYSLHSKKELSKTYVRYLNLDGFYPCFEFFSDFKKGVQEPLCD